MQRLIKVFYSPAEIEDNEYDEATLVDRILDEFDFKNGEIEELREEKERLKKEKANISTLLNLTYDGLAFWKGKSRLVTIYGVFGEVKAEMESAENLAQVYIEGIKNKLIEAGLLSKPPTRAERAYENGKRNYPLQSFYCYENECLNERIAYQKGWLEAADESIAKFRQEHNNLQATVAGA